MITTLFENQFGSVELNDKFFGVFGFMPLDPDGLTDDCIYYFSIDNGTIRMRGWNYGRSWDSTYVKDDEPWISNNPDAEESEFHDEEYKNELLDTLKKCMVITY